MTQTSTTLGPGAELKQAREAAAKSLDDIANYLHLTTQVVQTLEADRYQNKNHAIPFTFIRGYLRSYAKYLQLDADAIVAKFNEMKLVEPTTGRPALGLSRRPLSLRINTTRWLKYGLLFFALCLAIAGWRAQHAEITSETAQSPWVEVENTPSQTTAGGHSTHHTS